MNIIIESSINTLNKSKKLLESLSNDDLSDHTIPPYYSCIGSHIRHILDFYDCIFEGIASEKVNLIHRNRDERIHSDCDYAVLNVNRIIAKLESINHVCLDTIYTVTDDLGLGEVSIDYSLGAIFAQANSHAIHHYAIINYILDRLEITIQDETFGYNPTTPKPEINLS
ncbi:MAG: hypothetical protein R2785_04525 [Flavobacteriaceae bacterium]